MSGYLGIQQPVAADDNSVETVDIVDGAVTDAKLANPKLDTAGGTMTGNLNLGDNNKIQLGAGNDLQVYHDGAHSYISEVGTGNLRILGQNFSVRNHLNNESMITATPDAGVYLFYDNASKLATTATGIDVTGDIAADTISFAGGGIGSASGNRLYIGDGDTGVRFADDLNSIVPWNITTQGVANGVIDLGEHSDRFKDLYLSGSIYAQGNIDLEDNDKLLLGASDDLQIYHDGTHSYISDQGTGDLRLLGTNFRVKNSADTQSMIVGSDNGGVYLYHAGAQKFVTTATGVSVGTTSGSNDVDILSGTGGIGSLNFNDGVDSGYVKYNHNINALQIGSNGAERMRIDSTGNVGIGTVTPYTNGISIGNTDATAFISPGGNNNHLTLATTGAGGAVRFYTRGGTTDNRATTESMRITPAGNVGIGTTNPTYLLDVNKTTVPATDTYSDLQLQSNSYGYIISGGIKQGQGGRLRFIQNQNGSLTERVNIDSSGYLNVLSNPVRQGNSDGTPRYLNMPYNNDGSGNLTFTFDFVDIARNTSIPAGSSETNSFMFFVDVTCYLHKYIRAIVTIDTNLDNSIAWYTQGSNGLTGSASIPTNSESITITISNIWGNATNYFGKVTAIQ